MSLYLSFDYYKDQFTTWIMHVGMPCVQLYHAATSSILINTASSDAEGLEKFANVLLAPAQYVLAGRYFETQDGINYTYRQRFSYQEATSVMWMKTGVCVAAMPFSILLGGGIKWLCCFNDAVKTHQQKIAYAFYHKEPEGYEAFYNKLGIQLVSIQEADLIEKPKYARRPGDENTMQEDKQALKEVIALLHKHNIPYWLDCGTLLGAQRYGGVIPWDFDLDMAILQKDFDNAFRALNALDQEKYAVQDWSSRDRPKSYLKVYVKKTGLLIDIYNFEIDEQKQCIRSVLSNENCMFLPQSWKIRERRFIIDTPINYVFPLKKATFDGIEAFVPNQVESYLKQRYGDNIGPAKVYNISTGHYEKDLTHPYWQMPHAH